jgi:hypothetical protein
VTPLLGCPRTLCRRPSRPRLGGLRYGSFAAHMTLVVLRPSTPRQPPREAFAKRWPRPERCLRLPHDRTFCACGLGSQNSDRSQERSRCLTGAGSSTGAGGGVVVYSAHARAILERCTHDRRRPSAPGSCLFRRRDRAQGQVPGVAAPDSGHRPPATVRWLSTHCARMASTGGRWSERGWLSRWDFSSGPCWQLA